MLKVHAIIPQAENDIKVQDFIHLSGIQGSWVLNKLPIRSI